MTTIIDEGDESDEEDEGFEEPQKSWVEFSGIEGRSEKMKALKLSAIESAPQGAVVMLHGYGASPEDMSNAATWLSEASFFDIFCLEAPHSLPESGGTWKMWFFLEDWMIRLINNKPAAKSLYQNEQVTQDYIHSYELVKQIITQLSAEYRTLLVMGFSQGGMLASDVVFSMIKDHHQQNKPKAKLPVDGLALLSTAAFYRRVYDNLEQIAKLKGKGRQLDVIQTHGTTDPIVNVAHGKMLYEKIAQTYPKAKFSKDSGGHTVSPFQYLDLNDWFYDFHQ